MTEEIKLDMDDMEELSEEQLAQLMTLYKKELARIYKLNSAKKKILAVQKGPYLKQNLEQCDKEMRDDIDALKRKYGIHY